MEHEVLETFRSEPLLPPLTPSLTSLTSLLPKKSRFWHRCFVELFFVFLFGVIFFFFFAAALSPLRTRTPTPPSRNNMVRVCVKASRAEGPRRIHTNTAYAHLWGFNHPSSRRCVERLGFRVQGLGQKKKFNEKLVPKSTFFPGRGGEPGPLLPTPKLPSVNGNEAVSRVCPRRPLRMCNTSQ